jgi:hypothetical protein
VSSPETVTHIVEATKDGPCWGRTLCGVQSWEATRLERVTVERSKEIEREQELCVTCLVVRDGAKVKVRTTLDTGQDDADCNGDYGSVSFDTLAEAKAFMRGVRLASEATNGWTEGELEAELVAAEPAQTEGLLKTSNAFCVAFARARRLLAGELAPTSDVQRAALDAKPRNDDDWGTDRQVDAENAFFDLLRRETSWDTEGDDEWRSWACKATSEELIMGALAHRNQV